MPLKEAVFKHLQINTSSGFDEVTNFQHDVIRPTGTWFT